ncbi:calcineurin subunit B-like [Stylophora pistillata]|uniref:calcineurin subunit B-like n=1 Tax=Stylophora pistillata TaxID=50429 RepID=UPI000C044A2D|nr:calcineurin subunit B-like [Stylophora pistillata]
MGDDGRYLERFCVMAGKSYFSASVPKIVVQSLFKKYDTDENGHLSKKEALCLLKDDLGMDNKQAEACYLLVDKDGGGSISFEEFFSWFRDEKGLECVNDKSRCYYISKAVDEFKKYDKDGNGTIDKDELKLLLKAVNYRHDSDAALRALDTTGDGKISFPEFLAWLNWLPN